VVAPRDDAAIGPVQHSRSLCAVPAGCRCWCLPCEAHNRRLAAAPADRLRALLADFASSGTIDERAYLEDAVYHAVVSVLLPALAGTGAPPPAPSRPDTTQRWDY
jgi:hypothetical protein